MTTINVVRYADGRTIYNCKNPSYPPTNPKLGVDGNTVYWNGRTRETTVVVPRQQDEYFSRTSLTPSTLSSRNLQKIPTTTEKLPSIVKRSQSADQYGRVAPATLAQGKLQTTVSRYSTATSVVLRTPAPNGTLFCQNQTKRQ